MDEGSRSINGAPRTCRRALRRDAADAGVRRHEATVVIRALDGRGRGAPVDSATTDVHVVAFVDQVRSFLSVTGDSAQHEQYLPPDLFDV